MNNSLTEAKRKKNDEYYTKYEDVENELKHYKDYFKNKKVYLPCDSKDSNFYKFFKNNFKELQLDYLVATSFSKDGNGKMVIFDDGTEVSKDLDNNGDFRLQNDLRDFADIIITNAPFSLFRDFMDWVNNKDCIILGPITALTYKNIFPKIKDNELRLGVNFNKVISFIQPDGNEKKVSGIGWYTTFPVRKVKPLQLKTKAENEAAGIVYKKYDNYDAINVDRTKDIPSDYDGLMGVPITFLEKWVSEDYEIENALIDPKETKVNGKSKYAQIIVKKNFEIIRFRKGDDEKDLTVDNKNKYSRVIIRRK